MDENDPLYGRWCSLPSHPAGRPPRGCPSSTALSSCFCHLVPECRYLRVQVAPGVMFQVGFETWSESESEVVMDDNYRSGS
jgi:hypothetical protein